MTKPFQLVAGHPALDFVNTLDWRFRDSGAEELLTSYPELLRFSVESALLNANQARRLRRAANEQTGAQALRSGVELREIAAQIFYALTDRTTPPVASVVKLDQLLHTAQSNHRLRWTQARMEMVWPNSESDLNLPAWLLTLSASSLLTGDAIQSLRVCANPECRWLFLDTSRNHTRRWCEMKICGNRMKVRRFKTQHRA